MKLAAMARAAMRLVRYAVAESPHADETFTRTVGTELAARLLHSGTSITLRSHLDK